MGGWVSHWHGRGVEPPPHWHNVHNRFGGSGLSRPGSSFNRRRWLPPPVYVHACIERASSSPLTYWCAYTDRYDETEAQYVGEFCKGKRKGMGVLVYKDGSKFSGEFKDGVPHGSGELALSVDEWVMEGTWHQGKKHGVFVVRVSWKPATTWETRCYQMDELKWSRDFDYKLDFMSGTCQ